MIFQKPWALLTVWLLNFFKFLKSFDCSYDVSFCYFSDPSCSQTNCLSTVSGLGCYKNKVAENCIECNYDKNSCSNCLSNSFFLSLDGFCLPCSQNPNCNVCSSKSKVCSECQTGYYLFNSDCVPCSDKIPYCSKCANDGRCLVCNNNYYLDTSTQKCLGCSQSSSVANCLCTDQPSLCKICQSNYYLADDKSACISCTTKSNCLTCDPSANKCYQCADYFISIGSGCLANSNFCFSHSYTQGGVIMYRTDYFCLNCVSGYTPDANGICIACNIAHCLTCSQTTLGCVKCESGYFPQGKGCTDCINILYCEQCSTTKLECLKCQANYYLFVSYCLPCPSECAQCDGLICKSCTSGYFYFASSIPPYYQCLPCSKIINCETCSPTGFECTKCKVGTVLAGPTVCRDCPKNCATCESSSPFRCLNCTEGYFLQSGSCYECSSKPNCTSCETSSDKCLTCAQGFFSSGTSCQSCDPSCKTCKSKNEPCLLCKEGLYRENQVCVNKCTNPLKGVNVSGILKCQDFCPLSTYFESEPRFCVPCFEKCQTCSGGSPNQCLSCYNGTYFTQNGTCEACDKSCKTCENTPKYCLECNVGYENTQVSMHDCQLACTKNCDECSAEGVCLRCRAGYYLKKTKNQTTCPEKVYIDGILTEISNPESFRLKFTSRDWPEVFDSFSNHSNITMEGVNKSDISVKREVDSYDGLSYIYQFEFPDRLYNSEESRELAIALINIPPDSISSCCLLVKTNFTIKLNFERKKCYGNEHWDMEKKDCVAIRIINPYLRLTNDARKVSIIFDNDLPRELMFEMGKYLFFRIVVKDVPTPDITFDVKSQSNIIINILYEDEVKERPMLYVSIYFPLEITNQYFFQLKKEALFLQLMEYYKISSDDRDKIEKSKEAVEKGKSIASYIFTALNLLSKKASGTYKAQSLLNKMQLFKFVPVQYPPNLIAFFDNDFRKAAVGIRIDLPEGLSDGVLPDPYNLYNLSPYALNNCGSYLILCYGYFLIGFFILFVNRRLKKIYPENKIRKKLNDILTSYYVWSFPTSYFLAEVPRIFLLIALGVRYYSTNTPSGILNMGFCILFMIFLVVLLFRYFKVIHLLKKLPDFKNKEIAPENLRPMSEAEKQGNNEPNISELEKQTNSEPNSKNKKQENNQLTMMVEDITYDDKVTEEKIPFKEDGLKTTDNSEKGKTSYENLIEITPSSNVTKLDDTKNTQSTSTEAQPTSPGSKPKSPITITPSEKEKIEAENSPEGPLIIKNLDLANEDIPKPSQFSQIQPNSPVSLPSRERASTAARNSQPIIARLRSEINAEDARRISVENNPIEVSSPNIRRVYKERTYARYNSFDLNSVEYYQPEETEKPKKEKIKKLPKVYTTDELFEMSNMYKIYFSEYKRKSFLTRHFFVFDLLRQIIISAVLVYEEENGLKKILIITGVNAFYLLFFMCLRPLNDFLTFILIVMLEICLLIVCVLVTMIAKQDDDNNVDLAKKFELGWLVMGTNTAIIYIINILYIITFTKPIYEAIRSKCKRKKK